jgi:hypothetical protein
MIFLINFSGSKISLRTHDDPPLFIGENIRTAAENKMSHPWDIYVLFFFFCKGEIRTQDLALAT